MHTAGTFTAGKPNTDGQIFIPGHLMVSPGIVPTVLGTTPYVGPLVPASTASEIIVANFGSLLLRTGILQSNNFAANLSQEAFGTANGPGPSTVAGTSGPGGFDPNGVIPPILAANLPTLKGSKSGAQPKGIQVNWIDFLYQVLTNPPTTLSLTLESFSTAVGLDVTPAVAVIATTGTIDKTANSTNAKVHRARLTVTNPAMLVGDGSGLLALIQVVTPASSSVGIAGLILGVSYNFN